MHSGQRRVEAARAEGRLRAVSAVSGAKLPTCRAPLQAPRSVGGSSVTGCDVSWIWRLRVATINHN